MKSHKTCESIKTLNLQPPVTANHGMPAVHKLNSSFLIWEQLQCFRTHKQGSKVRGFQTGSGSSIHSFHLNGCFTFSLLGQNVPWALFFHSSSAPKHNILPSSRQEEPCISLILLIFPQDSSWALVDPQGSILKALEDWALTPVLKG